MLALRVEEQADSCPQGHRLSDWLDDDGVPLRPRDQPWVPEERVCPACEALEKARNAADAERAKQGLEEPDPGSYWTWRQATTGP